MVASVRSDQCLRPDRNHYSDLGGVMSNAGRSRNARLNQAENHLAMFDYALAELRGNFTKHEHVDLPATWTRAREALNSLVQCFHEANAYNNIVKDDQNADTR